MTIKSQAITLSEELPEKVVLSKMRGAVPASFEYVVKQNDHLVRFTSENSGPIRPLIALDKLNALDSGTPDIADGTLLLEQSKDLCFAVSVRGGVIGRVKSVLKDNLHQYEDGKRLTVVEESLAQHIDETLTETLPQLTDKELKASPHQFVEKKASLSPKAVIVGLVGLVCLSLATYLWLAPHSEESVEKEKVVKKVKKARYDPFYNYKAALQGRATYDEVANALISASLMSQKLPRGWLIERVTFSNGEVSANIINDNGRTRMLKYFRDNDPNAKYISVEGQHAKFSYPVEPINWWQWTNQMDRFVSVRDDFMDAMSILGASIRSQKPDLGDKEKFTQQKWEIKFEAVSTAYLEVLKTFLNDKPIFIDSVMVRPSTGQEIGKINIELIATVIGR